jgi:hypothetical protein
VWCSGCVLRGVCIVECVWCGCVCVVFVGVVCSAWFVCKLCGV